LEAVALDFETTGLDILRHEIIEIGAVRISAGEVRGDEILNRRIRPRGRITWASLRVHRIMRYKLAKEPPLEEYWPALRDFLGDTVIVGHHIAFDVGILRHQLRRLGIRWRRSPSLCTALLTLAARPSKPLEDLYDLAAPFIAGEPPGPRHNAYADAALCGYLFAGIIPELEARGIRTLADANAAQKAVAEKLRRTRHTFTPPG
jgi:DNA polymerase-3 subunit epsilon/CBS domain-containing protein